MTGDLDSHEDVDEIFESLAHPHRRHAIRCLGEYEEPITATDLADEIVGRENDSAVSEIPSEEAHQVYLSLYHQHLPKLDSAGIVRYDQDREMVQLVDDDRRDLYESLLEFV